MGGMANSLVKKAQGAESAVREYEANGETVRLSPEMIKRYLVSGGGEVTNEETIMFLNLCKHQHLNPWLREAYLIKYGTSQPATMVVGKDVFLKRAKKQSEFAGLQAGIIIQQEDGTIAEREGTFYNRKAETLLGGWAKAFIKGYQVPFYASVSMDEYIGTKKDGTPNSQWASKPATMIRKVALAQVLKEAFPDENAGLYAAEEIKEASEINLEAVAVPVEAEEIKAKPADIVEVKTVEPEDDEVANTLFDMGDK